MKPFTVSICGEPKVGKSTLISALAELTGARHDENIADAEEIIGSWSPIHSITVPFNEKQLLVRTMRGAFTYPERAYEHALAVADAVVYVLSAECSGEAEKWEREEYDRHRSIAERIGKTPAAVPWIFALNKTDIGNQEASAFELAQANDCPLVRTSAKHGIGIPSLWNAIIKTTSSGKVLWQYPAGFNDTAFIKRRNGPRSS